MPRKKHKRQHRARTSSQSSMEIQITDDERIITATTAITTAPVHTTPTQQASQALYFLNSDFLTLLKNVGATGEMSSKGEVFTFKQLGYYLKEYISVYKLFDETNPAIVHCDRDPLGKVFGVPSFTVLQAKSLLFKHASRLLGTLRDNETTAEDSAHCITHHNEQQDVITSTVKDITTGHETVQTGNLAHVEGHLDDGHTTTRPTTKRVENGPLSRKTPSPITLAHLTSPHCSKSQDNCTTTAITAFRISPALNTYAGHGGTSVSPTLQDHCSVRVKRRRRHKESVGSDNQPSSLEPRGTDEERHVRRRTSSISLVVDELPRYVDSYEWWQYVMPFIPSSDDSEILSIQSKDTMVVKSSSDEIWVTDEEYNQWTVDPAFEVEYDVTSDRNTGSDAGSVASDSTEIIEEPMALYLVCHESDVEWWADSESSDSSSDEWSSDADIEEEDKWICEQCQTKNSPRRGLCDWCMKVRPDWLPQPRTEHETRECYKRTTDNNEQSSSGEDEDDGPTQHTSISLTQSSTQRNCKISFDTPVDSGLELYSSQPSISNLPDTIGECDSGLYQDVSGDLLNRSFECPRPVTLHLPSQTLSVVPNAIWPGGTCSKDNSLSGTIGERLSGHVHDLHQTPYLAIDSGLASSHTGIHTSRDDSLSKIQQQSRISSLHVHSSLQLSKPRYEADQPESDGITQCTNQNANLKMKSTNCELPIDKNGMCKVCFQNPKDASIVHGNTGHQVCCYKCAKRLRRRGKTCPVCRRKIQKVIRNFIV